MLPFVKLTGISLKIIIRKETITQKDTFFMLLKFKYTIIYKTIQYSASYKWAPCKYIVVSQGQK